jgi:repressor LexA
MTIGTWIKRLRKERGLTQGALALRIGLTQQAIAKWETELSTPDYHMLVRLAKALEIEPDRLFSQDGMEESAGSKIGDHMHDRLDDHLRDKPDDPIRGKSRRISDKSTHPAFLHKRDLIVSHGQTMIPILGVVKAGYGLPAVEDELGMEAADVSDPSRYFYLEVSGDSMEPRIRNNDLALVRKQSTLADGDLGVVVYGDGEGTLKRFHRKGDTVALQAFNPAYETLIITGEELEKLFIIGKVIETKTRW